MSVVEDVEKSQPSYTAGRGPNGGVMLENSQAVPQKAKHRVANSMATILLPDIIRGKWIRMCRQKCIKLSSLSWNSQNVKMHSTEEHVYKMWYIHTVNISDKKKRSSDVYYNLDETWKHYVKLKKSVPKDRRSYRTFIWNVQKWEIRRDRKQISSARDQEESGKGEWQFTSMEVLIEVIKKYFEMKLWSWWSYNYVNRLTAIGLYTLILWHLICMVYEL